MTDKRDLIYMAACAAEKAAAAIMKIYNEGLNSVSYKNDRSPLTQADMDAHKVINECLSITGLPVLSEEGRAIPYEERKNWKEFWLVDPLDGTKEFINRNGEFTVNIALMSDNIPVGGVIVVPVWNKIYFAMQGYGAYMMNVSNLSSLHGFTEMTMRATKLEHSVANEHFTIVASRSHINDDTITFIEMMEQHFGKADYISRGSSLKFCILAEGNADVYPRFGRTMEWDTAAGHAIAMESGCDITLSDMKSPLQYNKEDLANENFIVWRKDFIRKFQ